MNYAQCIHDGTKRLLNCVLVEGAATPSQLPSSGNPLEFLRNQPQFQQMRQIIQQNPALLPALLQQLGRDNPQLLQVSGARYILYVN